MHIRLPVGAVVGAVVGLSVGACVGRVVGASVGLCVGWTVRKTHTIIVLIQAVMKVETLS